MAKQYIAPIDITSRKIMCMAEVLYDGSRSIKVEELLWVNMDLDYIKRGWDMLGERGLIVDMENDFYRPDDIKTDREILELIFQYYLN